jgi:outer membrane protein insertion porin family
MSTLYAQEGYILKNIIYQGNETFSSSELSEQVSMYTVNWFSGNIMGNDPYIFSEDLLISDINKLKYYYQAAGFLDVKISHEFAEIDKADRELSLIIHVNEGKPVVIDSVSFSFPVNQNLADGYSDSLLTTILENLHLKNGERFTDMLLKSDEQIILRNYLNSGFPYVKTKSKLILSDDLKTVSIQWLIEPGPMSYFGEIKIVGDKEVPESIIYKNLAFNKGDKYSQILIDTSYSDIYSLGLFQVVSIKTILTDDQNPEIPVILSVKKAPQITSRFGVGYGSEEKFRAFTETTKLSFLGGARRLNLFLRTSALEPYRIDLRFIQPSFLMRSLQLVINPFTRKQDEPGFRVRRIGIRNTVLYPFPFNLNTSFTYTYENVDQDTVDFGKDDLIFYDDYRGLYNKSMINLGLTRDTSFPLMDPVTGSLTSINFQYNGLIFPIEYPFFKTVLDARRYIGIAASVLALRLKIGGINPLKDDNFIPVEERFYSGGGFSIRGWGRHELGPKDDRGRPVGGSSLLELSTEFRYPILGIVSGVAFIDCGNVWLSEFTYPLNELRYSAGLGIRVNTPIGPVRLDVATPVFDEDKKTQFHFSIGHAF